MDDNRTYYTHKIGCDCCASSVEVTTFDKTSDDAYKAALALGWLYLRKRDRYFCPPCQFTAREVTKAVMANEKVSR